MRLGYCFHFTMRFDWIANILFPSVCVACHARIACGVVCEPCFLGIVLRDGFLCGECHAPLQFIGAAGLRASPCHPDFPYILGAATDYADTTVQSLIHHLKFRLIPGAADPLAELMIRYLEGAELRSAGFVAMPIPLSARRFRARGYNQAELIARRVARALDIPVVTDVLIRAKHTKPQSDTTSEAERRENIQGAYAITAHSAIRGANILLIDDVSTSGATFLEASRVLKAAGAGKIIAVAVAKT